MAKKKEEVKLLNTNEELLDKLQEHYDAAQSELDTRITHKEQGFDTYDRLYRSYIEPTKWPYSAKIFDPRAFGSILKKDTRLIASKLQGRLVTRKAGKELGARVGSELLACQWDEIDALTDEPMLTRLIRASGSARRYGAAFALVKWRYESGKFDGPNFEVLNNRDVLLQPGRSTIADSDYVIVRRYVTIEEIESINDISSKEPIYDKEAVKQLKKAKGSAVGDHYSSVNKMVRGLDSKAKNEERIELCTEYRRDRWITWAPYASGKGSKKKALILRDIKNPYEHREIPIARLVYYPIDDDIYGVSELEPVTTLQKALNALISQSFDTINIDLYPIVKLTNPTGITMTSLEFKPRAKWLMNAGSNVERLDSGTSSLAKFREMATYLIQAMNEALGETGQGVSSLAAFENDKTATEVKDSALLRNARDNFNKLMLSAFLGKVMYFWWSMDKQFLTDNKVIRIVGQDAMEYFTEQGLNGWKLNDEGHMLLSDVADELTAEAINAGQEPPSYEMVYEAMRQTGVLDEYAEPLYPVQIAGETVPKLQVSQDGKTGFLAFEGGVDGAGDYDYIPDVESMSLPNDKEIMNNKMTWYQLGTQAQQSLNQDGRRFKVEDALISIAKAMKQDDAERFFEDLPQQPMQGMPQAPSPLQQNEVNQAPAGM
jgi:hypothetical protein